ncbi:epidermal retinol dehydrogenase 2-like [Brachionus plicatilis]|uniref:Short-chain dehydrogenase/reductase 3 n=1 Tax=Brachionus plicatilis TaxID=10195 RepID=A0A3M7Q226_BRAPC|nr:epidermal retinol dehydrogenase 2-like [Brachionus plicatilis]
MKYIFELLFHFVVTLFLMIHGLIWGILKQIIPLRYRAKNIRNQNVLITGTGSGIGKLLAKKMAKLGAFCILIDINEKKNSETAQEIKFENGKALTLTCDLSDKNQIFKLYHQIKKSMDHVDLLINNAGIVNGKKFLDSSDQSIEKTFNVNTLSHIWMNKAFLPDMIKKNHGHIVTISSMAGLFGAAGLCDYCASKSAIIGFDESLRNELLRLHKTGVKTTLVCPNVISTGMFNGYNSVIPELDPYYVADKIIEAILTEQKVLLIPKIMYFLYFFKTMISHETESYLAKYVFKTCYAMDNFKGKKE